MFKLLSTLITLSSCTITSRECPAALDLAVIDENFRGIVGQFSSEPETVYSISIDNATTPFEMDVSEFVDIEFRASQPNVSADLSKVKNLIARKIKIIFESYSTEQAQFRLLGPNMVITQVGNNPISGQAVVRDESSIDINTGDNTENNTNYPNNMFIAQNISIMGYDESKFVIAMFVKLKDDIVFNPFSQSGFSKLDQKPAGVPEIYITDVISGMILQKQPTSLKLMSAASITEIENKIASDFGQGKTFAITSPINDNNNVHYADGHVEPFSSFTNNLVSTTSTMENAFTNYLSKEATSIPATEHTESHLYINEIGSLRRMGRVFSIEQELNGIVSSYVFLRTEANGKAIYGVDIMFSPINAISADGSLVNATYNVIKESNGSISIDSHDITGANLSTEISYITYSVVYTEQ